MKIIIRGTLATLGLGIALGVSAGPVEDQAAFQKYYESRFPNTPTADFANGVYSILPEAREQWESIEEFHPTRSRSRTERSSTIKVRQRQVFGRLFRARGCGPGAIPALG